MRRPDSKIGHKLVALISLAGISHRPERRDKFRLFIYFYYVIPCERGHLLPAQSAPK